MAATVSSAWSKPGAWALDSEEHEDELLHQGTVPAAAEPRRATAALNDFPSLSAAATTKSKKKKGQTLSLAEFKTLGAYKPVQTAEPKGRTAEDLLVLPTGPRERTAEELDRNRLGGGFKSYGSNRYSSRDESANPRWGSSRDSDDEPRRQSRELAPSRADETDDWGASKKSTFGNGGFDRRERGERGGFFDSQSRADESNSWVSNKSFVPSEGRRFGSGGGAFDSLRERRGGGFESNGGGPDSENWGKRKEERGPSGGAFDSLSRERRGGFETGTNGGADSDIWGKKREESVGNARPKLNLQPRKLPVAEGQQNGNGSPVKPKGSNPFGDARPREEVLKEKGQDWKEIDEKLESIKMKEMAAAATDGPSFGKRSFGSGNGRAGFSEGREERSWRKPESVDSPPPSEKMEDGHVEEAEGSDLQE